MSFFIEPYQSKNKPVLVKFMEELQDYLVKLDPLQKKRRLPAYGQIYTEKLLKKVEQNKGIIYFAKLNDTFCGVIVGIIQEQDEADLLEFVPSKTGRIIELYVDSSFRGQKAGTALMMAIEKYFKNQGCNFVRLEVFETNIAAHKFYKNLGYDDRNIDMIKEL